MNSGGFQKTWLADSLNRFAERKALDAIQATGRALPCSVVTVVSSGIVTVKFEVQSNFTLPVVTVPKWGTEWMRYPTQVGDKGMVIAADAYLGGVSGLGGGVASLAQRGNLSTLVFVPIGNTSWSSVDLNQVVLYGPDGCVLRDSTNAASITVQPSSITLSCGGHSIVINSTGVIIDGKTFLTHQHTGVQTGSSDTGGVA